jgi:predicted RNase H-like HicB family nuclease
MKYHFRIRKEKVGYLAQCIELEGCITQGDSLKELFENMSEALNIYILEPEDFREIVPLPNEDIRPSKRKKIVEIPLEPSIAFSFMLRYHRIKNHLTQQEAAKKMGFEHVYEYQRLEKRGNATIKMIAKVKKLFPDFSVDWAFA